MSGGVRPESKPETLGGTAQVVEDYSRLDPGQTPFGVDLQNPVHVLRHVHHDRLVAALTGEAGACAPGQQRSPGLCRHPGRRLDVCLVERKDDAKGYLPVVRGVTGKGGARRAVEADLASYGTGECPSQGLTLSFS